MRTLPILASLSVLAAGAFNFSQSEEPAEKVFKNIKVFNGVPAKDIMPAMRFMNAALKVDCTFCHDPNDYAADVPHKEVARKMVEMQRNINKTFFEGRLEVTCNSCHNGKSHPEGMPAIANLANRHPRFRSEQPPAELFKKHLDAVGGAGQILRFKGTLKEGAGPEAPFEVVQAPDGRFLADLDGLKMGWDGTTAWTNDGTTTVKLWGDDAFSLARMGRTYRLQSYFEGYERPVVNARETLGEMKTLVVRGTLTKNGVVEELYFDEATGLLARVAIFTRSSIGSVPSYVDYSDYRTVDGIRVPFRISSLSMNNAVTVAQYKSGEVATGFDVKGFSPPAN